MGGGGIGGINAMLNNDPRIAQAREDAWTAKVRADPAYQLLEEEKRRKAQEAKDKQNALDLNSALSKQKEFSSKSQGRQGTVLTSPLGVVGGGQTFGQKTLIGQ